MLNRLFGLVACGDSIKTRLRVCKRLFRILWVQWRGQTVGGKIGKWHATTLEKIDGKQCNAIKKGRVSTTEKIEIQWNDCQSVAIRTKKRRVTL